MTIELGDPSVAFKGVFKVYPTSAAGRIIAQIQENAESVRNEEPKGVVALNNVSLSIPRNAISVIMGLSGSGKSTLIRCINRLTDPDCGEVLIDGQDILKLTDVKLRDFRRNNIAMVFQHFALLPNCTVEENVQFGLRLRGERGAVRSKKAQVALELVGLAKWANNYPHELSGGMKQRVGLARALVTDADILLMDEPFSALDPIIRREMQNELLRLQSDLKKTIIFVSHDMQEAVRLGGQITVMASGKVVQTGSPTDILQRPVNEYVRAFSSDVNKSIILNAEMIMTPAFPPKANEEQSKGNSGIQKDAGPTQASHVLTTASLAEVAAVCRSSHPVAVVDKNGHVVGSIDVEQLLGSFSK